MAAGRQAPQSSRRSRGLDTLSPQHLEAEYQRLYPQTALPNSKHAEWRAILDDPMRGVAYLMAQVPSDCPEYEERYNFAFRR